MNTGDVAKLFVDIRDELAANGLALLPGWKFALDSAGRRFGCCDHSRKTISISTKIAALNDEKTVGQTIRHEIAHAFVGPFHGHDAVWKAMAIRLWRRRQTKRCYDDEKVTTPQGAWEAVCPGCGWISKRTRPPKPNRLYGCGLAGFGYVAIDAAFGIHGKKGWWSWKIMKKLEGK